MSDTPRAPAASGGTSRSAMPRSVALIGPYASGKSTLFDALLAAAGAPVRYPGGNRERVIGTELRLGHCEYLGDAWSILDCPGSIEFLHETQAALSVVDLAVLVCEPAPVRAPAAAPVLKLIAEIGVPFIVFVNKIDTLDGRIRDTVEALQAYTDAPLVLRQVPIRDGDKVSGYVDVVSERAYRYRRGQRSEIVPLPSGLREREQEARAAMLEVLADHDDALLEKLLEDVAPATEEIFHDLRKDLAAGAVSEILLGSAEAGGGVRRLWKALRHDAPGPDETAARHGIDPDGPPLAQAFKTVHAGHAGKLTYARVWRGSIRDGAVLSSVGSAGVRLGGIHRMPGGEAAKVDAAGAGELVALGRLDGVPTGATLWPNGAPAASPIAARPISALAFPAPPPPVYALAIVTVDRKDDVKLSAALARLCEEDPALSVAQDPETNETVLRGQGEIHLNAAIERLARNHGLRLSCARPAVAYKETIRQAVRQHSRLKRQTGGHGQFADVKLDIAPRARGEGFQFIDRVVGGAVPRQYIPAVAEAAEDAARKGPFGFPVVDISVALVDGGFHSVDSSDMAFKSATRMAMAEALAKAAPVLLEPIDQVSICVLNEHTPRVQRLLTGRRGQILGYAARPGWPGWDEVQALVPRAELHDLIIELRSQTLGLGTYTHRFDHLAESR